MVYISLSAFTANSAGFVYNRAGILSEDITDDMVSFILRIYLINPPSWLHTDLQPLCRNRSRDYLPSDSTPKRLEFSSRRWHTHSTDFMRSIAFIGKQSEVSCCVFQIARRFPGLMMKLVVKTAKDPVASFEPNSMTVNATGTVTAYAIQPNGALTSLFVLNLVGYTAGMTKRRTKTSIYCFAEKNYSRLLCYPVVQAVCGSCSKDVSSRCRYSALLANWTTIYIANWAR